MNSLLIALMSITGLFILLLLIKSIVKKEFCVICGAVTLTWIGLLTAKYLELFTDTIVIALLLGHTSLGVFYLLEKRVSKQWLIFRLPLLLTLLSLTYLLLTETKDILTILAFLFLLWLALGLLLMIQTNQSLQKIVNKIIACCRSW